jgi:hypothetical protein
LVVAPDVKVDIARVDASDVQAILLVCCQSIGTADLLSELVADDFGDLVLINRFHDVELDVAIDETTPAITPATAAETSNVKDRVGHSASKGI